MKIDTENLIKLHYEVRNKNKLVIYYPAELIDLSINVKLSEEHTDFVWLDIEAACVKAEYADMQGALRKVYASLAWMIIS